VSNAAWVAGGAPHRCLWYPRPPPARPASSQPSPCRARAPSYEWRLPTRRGGASGPGTSGAACAATRRDLHFVVSARTRHSAGDRGAPSSTSALRKRRRASRLSLPGAGVRCLALALARDSAAPRTVDGCVAHQRRVLLHTHRAHLRHRQRRERGRTSTLAPPPHPVVAAVVQDEVLPQRDLPLARLAHGLQPAGPESARSRQRRSTGRAHVK